VNNSDKIIHLLDMAGHQKYLKTTMHGISSTFPDYALIVIDSNKGPQSMTIEHLGICHGLKLPFFFVLTKTDMAQEK